MSKYVHSNRENRKCSHLFHENGVKKRFNWKYITPGWTARPATNIAADFGAGWPIAPPAAPSAARDTRWPAVRPPRSSAPVFHQILKESFQKSSFLKDSLGFVKILRNCHLFQRGSKALGNIVNNCVKNSYSDIFCNSWHHNDWCSFWCFYFPLLLVSLHPEPLREPSVF